MTNTELDKNLTSLTQQQLIEEIKKLRAGIRNHRDSTAHNLCWHHPELWALLPDPPTSMPSVPEWPQFMRGCIKYRQSLDEQCPQAPRTKQEYEE